MSDFHLQEIQTLQNSLREREEYVIELENRLRALWDKYDGDSKYYMARIKRLESVENSHSDVLKAIDNWMQQHKTKEAKL